MWFGEHLRLRDAVKLISPLPETAVSQDDLMTEQVANST
jgi:hypothetical protein